MVDSALKQKIIEMRLKHYVQFVVENANNSFNLLTLFNLILYYFQVIISFSSNNKFSYF
mgnify:CR=1 FL=1